MSVTSRNNTDPVVTQWWWWWWWLWQCTNTASRNRKH